MAALAQQGDVVGAVVAAVHADEDLRFQIQRGDAIQRLLQELGRAFLTMLAAGAQLVMQGPALRADVGEDGREAVHAFVGAPELLAVVAAVVEGAHVHVAGDVGAALHGECGGAVVLDEGEIGRVDLRGDGGGFGERFEALAQDGLAGHEGQAEAAGEVLGLGLGVGLAEQLDVIVMAAALHEQAELADEDVRIAEAVAAPCGVAAEGAAQAAELFEERADERKSALGVDGFVSQCKGGHVATCWVGFVTSPFTSLRGGLPRSLLSLAHGFRKEIGKDRPVEELLEQAHGGRGLLCPQSVAERS